jgi:hypothetical protein
METAQRQLGHSCVRGIAAVWFGRGLIVEDNVKLAAAVAEKVRLKQRLKRPREDGAGEIVAAGARRSKAHAHGHVVLLGPSSATEEQQVYSVM